MASNATRSDAAHPATRRNRYRVLDAERKHVRKACEICRRHKLRCDGALPCTRCAEMDKRCQYAQKPDLASKSLPRASTEDGILINRSAEDQVGIMRDIILIEHPEAAESLDALRKLRESLLKASRGHCGNTSLNAGTGELDQDSSPQNYVPCHHTEEHDHQSEPNASNSAASVTVSNQGKTRFEGNSSVWAFFDAARRHGLPSGEDSTVANEAETSVHPVSIHSFGTDLHTMIRNALPPKGAVEFLSSTFFRVAQSNYFCIHPEIYYRKLKTFYDSSTNFDSHDAAAFQRSIEFVSLLFMVLAIGAQFADVGTKSSQVEADTDWTVYEHSPQRLSEITIPASKQNPGWQFCEVSRKLLPDVVCSSSMTSIQVCVLQGIFLPSTGDRDAGYNLLGLALRMAINMGLHRSIRCKQLHPQVRELRNRLWWTVYVAERMYSIEMGRPLAISDSEVDASYPMDNADTDPALPGIGGLLGMIEICKILGKIVQVVYCDAASAQGTVMRPMVVRELKRDLDRWRDQLPSEMRVDTRPFRRSVAHLALMYEQAVILLTRPCLHIAALPTQAVTTPNEDARKFLRQEAQDCVAAALSSISLLAKLKSAALLCPFSMHDGIYCSSALHVLHMASKMPNVAPEVGMKDVFHGFSILMELAEGSELAAVNLRYITQAIAASRKQKSQDLHESDTLRQEGDEDKGRNEWREWAARSTIGKISSTLTTKLPQDEDLTYPHADILGLSDGAATELQADWQGTTNPQLEITTWLPKPIDHLGADPVVSLSFNQLNRNCDTSIAWDMTPFTIPGTSEFDILGRDLGYLPENY